MTDKYIHYMRSFTFSFCISLLDTEHFFLNTKLMKEGWINIIRFLSIVSELVRESDADCATNRPSYGLFCASISLYIAKIINTN